MENLFEFSPIIIAIVPVIVGLVQIGKGLGLASKYAPVVSIIAGIGLVALTTVAWQAFVVQGIIAGLAASGLYSGGKAVVKKG